MILSSIIIRYKLLLMLINLINSSTKDTFHEELFLKTLQNGQLYAHFQFITTWNISLKSEQSKHYHLFPRALGEILDKYSVKELHLSFTQGHWRHESWGYPVLDASTGAELLTWFSSNAANVDENWLNLINALSGMFCSSLNFMDLKSTITPKLNFRLKGASSEQYNKWFSANTRYSVLAGENVCTENLTPWKKLLPCGLKSGLSTLLNSIKLYDASYHSLGIHFRNICLEEGCNSIGLEFMQTLGVVFDPIVNLDNFDKADWSFKRYFGRVVTEFCPLASISKVYFDVSTGVENFQLSPSPSYIDRIDRGETRVSHAVYDILEYLSSRNSRVFNLEIKYTNGFYFLKAKQPPLVTVHRFLTGDGQVKGGIVCLIHNRHPTENILATYLELIPWFLRSYLHTLKIEYFPLGRVRINERGIEIKPVYTHYIPGRDYSKPYHIETAFYLPALSTIRFSFQFERQLLKWTDYPPDANHGFHIASSVLSFDLPDANNYTASVKHHSLIDKIFQNNNNNKYNKIINENILDNNNNSSVGNTNENMFFVQLHTEALLVTLPVPDFSMPYNVICLVCTVIAIAFGSFHNLTTRNLVYYDPRKYRGFMKVVKEKFDSWKLKRYGKDKTKKIECEIEESKKEKDE